MPLSQEQEAMLRSAGMTTLLTNLVMSEKLSQILQEDPIDGLDLNPHLQIQHVADQVVDYMRMEKKENVDREDVILLWLTENIMGHRSDRARMEPL